LYYPEGRSAALIAHLHDRPLPLLFTCLHEVEFTNGLQLKLFRKEADAASVAATLDALHADGESGVLHRAQPSWPAVLATTLRLSRAHSGSVGTRTLDLLHIAAAITLQATEFVTGYDRQARAATKEGLNAIRI
jgi:hypothetical protein